MTDSQYLSNALDFIVYRERDNDYICERLHESPREATICKNDCQGLCRNCVLRFLESFEKNYTMNKQVQQIRDYIEKQLDEVAVGDERAVYEDLLKFIDNLSNLKSIGEKWSKEDEKEWKSIVSVLTRMHFLDELEWLRSKLNR